MLTIVRGLAVPEMVSREAYGAINGALVAPMNVMQALSPLLAAWIWSATGGYDAVLVAIGAAAVSRSEEHTSELQSLMRISYAVFCLKKKTTLTKHHTHNHAN